MYVKTTSRTNKDGTPVRYLHLAHNEWDPAASRSVPKVLYSFGREDALDRAAVKRLVASLGIAAPATGWRYADLRLHLAGPLDSPNYVERRAGGRAVTDRRG